jgi:hypothetical protein
MSSLLISTLQKDSLLLKFGMREDWGQIEPTPVWRTLREGVYPIVKGVSDEGTERVQPGVQAGGDPTVGGGEKESRGNIGDSHVIML